MSRQRVSGFTLIEILVVLVVVGMLVALATFTMGGNSVRRDLDNEVEKMFLLMQTVSEQAVLNNTEFGLIVEEDQYRFLAFDQRAGTWKPSAERLYRSREIPEWMLVTEYIENDAPRLASGDDEDTPRPDVVLFSSGETTPFELEFTISRDGLAAEDYVHSVFSDGVSPIEWQHPGDPEVEAE
ncbi:type II secretion system minor pseudopilin GspH [Marinobacter confluentis]|uniref:Type II secretion system protein H n=1 Tax=Marinobacter confluentis TaxID=1697557 RepID=A0A4Z1CCP8_9GAMM|nr:type II secretion system minor pseudopilin GspH [Marinobacter confluentis]TGN42046.1 type II secretion system protein GspH [Marinobacter confluentis]